MKSIVTLFLLSVITLSCIQTVGKNDMITKANAKEVTTFDENDIESMVTYYFASRIRGDQDWKKVLPDPKTWSDRMQYSIKAHDTWKFVNFQNKGLYEGKYGNYVKVFFTIKEGGKEDGGTDDVELRKENGKWVINKVPT